MQNSSDTGKLTAKGLIVEKNIYRFIHLKITVSLQTEMGEFYSECYCNKGFQIKPVKSWKPDIFLLA